MSEKTHRTFEFPEEEEILGEVKIIITTGFPKITVTTFKDGCPVETSIDKIKTIYEPYQQKILIEKIVILSYHSSVTTPNRKTLEKSTE